MNEIDNKKQGKEKKELTLQQLQRRKKMIVFPLFFLIFCGAMWLIYAPSEDTTGQQIDGFNPDIPMPTEQGIVSDKRDAYELEAQKLKEQEKMKSLQDFAFMLGEEEKSQEVYERHVKMAPVPPDYQEQPDRGSSSRSSASTSFQTSAQNYRDINRQLESFYEEPTANINEKSPVEKRIEELERKLEDSEREKKETDDQMAVIEKSYQIAAKYMSAGQSPIITNPEQTSPVTIPATASSNNKAVAQPVKQVRQNVVSLLSVPLSDEEFVERYSKPRNIGFNTAAGNEGIVDKNSIRACIYKTVTIVNGQEVQLRLLEPMQAGVYIIPENTIITGTTKINGERVNILITSIQHSDNVIPVEIQVYDVDGNSGISVPGSEEINALKEIAANMGSSAGTSIMISDNAGSQLAADMGKGVIQGASEYVSKKVRTVKVTLKANHRVLLMSKQ